MPRDWKWVGGLLLLALSAGAMATELSVTNARLRLLPGDLPAAGYFSLSNQGKKPAVLVGAESPAFERAMVHKSTQENGIAGMKPVPRLELQPGETVEFAPGGYHLMLMQRKKPLAVGDKVRATLLFQDGRRLPMVFVAVAPASL